MAAGRLSAAFSQVGLPPGAIVDGEVHDPSAVSDAVVRLWRNGKFSSKSVVVGVAGLRAITREFDLPWVPDDEVDSAVRYQSEEVIPFPPDKTILSAQVLSDYQAPDGTTQRHVLVAAAHRDLIDGVIGAVEKAGLHVERVELVSSALVRALVGSVPQAEQPEAIVSVGAGLTVIVVHQQGRPQFVRTIGMGSNSATAAISSVLDVPFSDAEIMKRRLGAADPQLEPAERAVQGTISELVGEIRNSIQYFASLPGRFPIAGVTVTGAGARLRGLVEQLQAQVRMPVTFVSPLSRPGPLGFRSLTRTDGDFRVRACRTDRPRPARAEPDGEKVQPGSSRRDPTGTPPPVSQGDCNRRGYGARAHMRCECLELPSGSQREG